MIQIKEGDFVIIKDTGNIGEVIEVLYDPFQYRVRDHGTSSTHSPGDILGLNPAQVHVLNVTLRSVAQVIDLYRGDDVYDPVYDATGEIVYSAPAAAIFSILDFPRLILEIGNLSDKVALLEHHLQEAKAQR